MTFGWINLCGLLFALAMAIPTLWMSHRHKEYCGLAEKAGGYVFGMSLINMVFPEYGGEFGFATVAAMVVYVIGNLLLTAVYFVTAASCHNNRERYLRGTLRIQPALVFLLSAITLQHVELAVHGLLYGVLSVVQVLMNRKKGQA